MYLDFHTLLALYLCPHPFLAILFKKVNLTFSPQCEAKHGYLQVPLDEASQLLITFLTEWGTWCYLRMPMGLICSGGIFCEWTDFALTVFLGMLKVIDDIHVYGDTRVAKIIQNLTLRIASSFHNFWRVCLENSSQFWL